MNGLNFNIPISKVEELEDGSVIVEGVATSEALDSDGEIVSYEASKRAFEGWTEAFQKMTDGESLGNIREMHRDDAVAGKAIGYFADDEAKKITVRSKIVDTEAAKKCREKVYTGYSIRSMGPVAREVFKVGDQSVPVITDYQMRELSLVDRGANGDAIFTLVKRDKSGDDDAKKTDGARGENAELVKTIAAAVTESLSKSEDNKLILEALTKIGASIDSQGDLLKTVKDEATEAAKKAADGSVSTVRDELRKTMESLGERLETVESTPAEAGRKAKPAEKGLGSGSDGKEENSLEKLRGMLDEGVRKGEIQSEAEHEMRRLLAEAAMPRVSAS